MKYQSFGQDYLGLPFFGQIVMFGVEPEVFRCKTSFNKFVKRQFICQIVLSKQKTYHRSIDLRSNKTIGRYFKTQFTQNQQPTSAEIFSFGPELQV